MEENEVLDGNAGKNQLDDSKEAKDHKGMFDASIEKRKNSFDKSLETLRSQMKICSPAELPFDSTENLLKDRYKILCDEPLRNLSYGFIKAYAAKDLKNPEKKLYAAICHPEHPPRINESDRLMKKEIDGFISPISSGPVKVSAFDEYRYVYIFRQPKGDKLSDFLRKQGIIEDDYFVKTILIPIIFMIEKIATQSVCHGRIHPDNIWIGEKVTLGECVSSPCGIGQEYLYEPPERITANEEGKGKGNSKVDVYALGVLGIECIFGMDKIRQLDKNMFLSAMLEYGSIYIFTIKRSIPNSVSDYILGCMNAKISERWNYEYLVHWANGKRYNLVQMSSGTEASRAFDFAGKNYYSTMALANGLYAHWEQAKDNIRNNNISRWLEQALNRKEQSELIQRAIKNTGGTKAAANKHNAELVARSIIILDSSGPLRIESISFHISGIGYMISNALFHQENGRMGPIINAIAYDLPTVQADMNADIYNENTDILWSLEKARQNMQKNQFGFGVERALYDMNPNIPCMSNIVKGYFITNNRELLLTLNYLAMAKGIDDSLADRHLAAFCASRASMFKDIKFKALKNFPHLAENNEMHVIYILALAQRTEKIKSLQSLSHWCALRMHRLLEEINSIKIRSAMGTELQQAAKKGNLSSVLHYFIDTPTFDSDKAGFEKAVRLFAINRMKIHKMKCTDNLKSQAKAKGTAIAAACSFCIFLISTYLAIKDNFL